MCTRIHLYKQGFYRNIVVNKEWFSEGRYEMKWIVILRKDKYALLQSKSDTQYAVVSDYDPAQSEDWQWSSGTHFIYWNNAERKTICLQNALDLFTKCAIPL